MSSKNEEKTQATAKGLSRAQAERAAVFVARNVNAYGQKEEGPSRWQEKREAKRQMYLLSTEKTVRLGERKDKTTMTTTMGALHWTKSSCQSRWESMLRMEEQEQVQLPLPVSVSVPVPVEEQALVEEQEQVPLLVSVPIEEQAPVEEQVSVIPPPHHYWTREYDIVLLARVATHGKRWADPLPEMQELPVIPSVIPPLQEQELPVIPPVIPPLQEQELQVWSPGYTS
ncbi:hypothetical protein V6N11_046629 [Hibiscus sabdariffa]|uniref:Uncharacterized protein n=1 Tax=Hibiscus sabdariffa TaxID=183260 RepID=A0ABR2P2S8_9ROSI